MEIKISYLLFGTVDSEMEVSAQEVHWRKCSQVTLVKEEGKN